MQILIDETSIKVEDPNLNIVQIAKANGITIPSPCFNTNYEYGCCKACIIEIDDAIHYACGTKPADGLKIIIDREDLNKLRINRLKKYYENKQNNTAGECCCGCGPDSF